MNKLENFVKFIDEMSDIFLKNYFSEVSLQNLVLLNPIFH